MAEGGIHLLVSKIAVYNWRAGASGTNGTIFLFLSLEKMPFVVNKKGKERRASETSEQREARLSRRRLRDRERARQRKQRKKGKHD